MLGLVLTVLIGMAATLFGMLILKKKRRAPEDLERYSMRLAAEEAARLIDSHKR